MSTHWYCIWNTDYFLYIGSDTKWSVGRSDVYAAYTVLDTFECIFKCIPFFAMIAFPAKI